MASNSTSRRGFNPPSQKLGQEEVPIAIIQWGGLKSAYPPTSIPVNSFTRLLNKDFIDPTTITTRQGCGLLFGHHLIGYAVAACEFVIGGISNIFIVTRDGRLLRTPTTIGYRTVNTGNSIADTATLFPAATLVGNLTQGQAISRARFAKFRGNLYIADGFNFWQFNPATNVLSNFTANLGAQSGSYIIDTLAWGSRLWILTNLSELRGSAINDVSDFLTTNSAWQVTVGDGDGMFNKSIVPWGKSMLINKGDYASSKAAMYKLDGYLATNFVIQPLFGDEQTPTAFLGNSAARVGNDVIGLTYDGFITVSAINNFQTASIAPLSLDIDDIVKRINFNASDSIKGIYDIQTNQYMCAVPLDNATIPNAVIIYDIRGQRWGLYDNWPVLDFFYAEGTVCFVGYTADRNEFYLFNINGGGVTAFSYSSVYPGDNSPGGLQWIPSGALEVPECGKLVYFSSGSGLPVEANPPLLGNNFLFYTRRGKYFSDDVFLNYDKTVETGDLTFDSPESIKLFKSVELNIAQENDYSVDVTTIIDGADNIADKVRLNVTGSEGRWDEFTWDVDYWDSSPNTQQTLMVNARGKTIRMRLENNNLNEQFSLRGMVFRLFKTDTGTAIGNATSTSLVDIVDLQP